MLFRVLSFHICLTCCTGSICLIVSCYIHVHIISYSVVPCSTLYHAIQLEKILFMEKMRGLIESSWNMLKQCFSKQRGLKAFETEASRGRAVGHKHNVLTMSLD